MRTPDNYQKKEVMIPRDNGIILIKRDAIEDKCVPRILEMLINSGLRVSAFIPVRLTGQQAANLYDLHLRQDNLFVQEGVRNLTGDIFLVSLEGNSPTEAWDLIRRIKGQPHIEGSTVRFMLTRYLDKALPQEEYARLVIRNRIHVPMDDAEVNKMAEVLVENNVFIK